MVKPIPITGIWNVCVFFILFISDKTKIHISNLVMIDPKSGDATKVGRKINKKSGKIIRYSKKSGEIIK